MKRHMVFRCPFCRRKIEPRKGQRACICGYWIRPVSKNEIQEAEEQSILLSNTNSHYICQESWTELKNE